jgi:DNA-directed RNA polymerase subunit L
MPGQSHPMTSRPKWTVRANEDTRRAVTVRVARAAAEALSDHIDEFGISPAELIFTSQMG